MKKNNKNFIHVAPKREASTSNPRGGEYRENIEFGKVPMLKSSDGKYGGNLDQFRRAFEVYCQGQYRRVAQVISTLKPFNPAEEEKKSHSRSSNCRRGNLGWRTIKRSTCSGGTGGSVR